jgi:tetratricopeptide (TPR) repeat protein
MVTSLRSYLSTEDFRARLANIERRMKDLYRFWQVHAPHYTDHGETHCKTVERNLDELIPDELKNEINEYEIFLLLSGVYLHDVGIMCASTSEEENEEIRKTHHKRSEEFIIDNVKDTLNGPERYVVGRIAFAHRDSVPLDDVILERTIRHETLGNKQVRVRYLAGLLRLADSCDLCHTRTTEEIATVGKLSEEASFHHALHQRVSGISFDTKEKTIYIDLNIASEEEKSICQKYLVAKLQKSLDTLKDHLIRNGIVYIGVSPRFTTTSTLTTKLSVPKGMETAEEAAITAQARWGRTAEAAPLIRLAYTFYSDNKPKEGLKYCNDALKLAPRNPLAWFIKANIHAQLLELKEACRCYDKVAKFGSDDPFYNTDIGHFYGEVMFNYKKSFTFFEKAYQQSPSDIVRTLNYAESLITVDKPQEGYNLATRIWSKTTDIIRRFQSEILRVISLFFLGEEQKALQELEKFFYFVKGCYSLINEKNEWVYNKIRKYIHDSSLDKYAKDFLTELIDLAEGKISVDDFEKELDKFTKRKP